MEQFKPLIEELSSEERQVLVQISMGNTVIKKLQKATGIKTILPVLAKLENHGMIKRDNSLSKRGEVIATLLNLIPEF